MPHHLMLIQATSHGADRTLHGLISADESFRCEARTWELFGPESLANSRADLIVAEDGAEAKELLRLTDWTQKPSWRMPVLAILSEGIPDDVLRAVGETVDDFMFSPIRASELRQRLIRLLGSSPRPDDPGALGSLLLQESGLEHFVGRHPAFVEMVKRIPLLARSEAPVLLIGETGTGKELCARAIHQLSARKAGPFIPVECGALPEHLVENELFGHSRGAFTDARSDQKGLVAMANGGTLFLDEIDSLSLAAQAKLLRFLQERTFKPLGAERYSHSNVRVIAATNRNLEDCIREQRFRSDLYFRINVLRLDLPALRERRDDIKLLSVRFLRNFAKESGSVVKSLSTSALRTLEQYHWPGNVRELMNLLQRAVVLAPGREILPIHLGLPSPPAAPHDRSLLFSEARAKAVNEFERAYVEQMLRKHAGNITQGAQEAGKDRRAFGRLVKKYGIDRLNP